MCRMSIRYTLNKERTMPFLIFAPLILSYYLFFILLLPFMRSSPTGLFILYYQLCSIFATIIKQVRTFTTTIMVLSIATILSWSFVLSSLKDPMVYFHIVHNFLILVYLLSITTYGKDVVSLSKHSMVLTLSFYQVSSSFFNYYVCT